MRYKNNIRILENVNALCCFFLFVFEFFLNNSSKRFFSKKIARNILYFFYLVFISIPFITTRTREQENGSCKIKTKHNHNVKHTSTILPVCISCSNPVPPSAGVANRTSKTISIFAFQPYYSSYDMRENYLTHPVSVYYNTNLKESPGARPATYVSGLFEVN